MSVIRAILASARGRIVLAVLALYCVFQLWQTLSAPGKIDPELIAGQGPRVNVTVKLPFPPERFHVLAFQRFGRVAGADGDEVELRGVLRENLTKLARPYWVKRVEKMQEGG